MSVAQNNPMHGWHTYCTEEFNNAIGGGIPFIAATCYPPEMAINYAGTQITKVGIYSDTLYNAVGGTYTCSVYVGGDTPDEGVIASTITVEVLQGLGDWAEFDLNTPVWVTGNVSIWIVWRCDQQLSNWPMGVCGVSDPSGNGNWHGDPFGWGWDHLEYGDWTVKTYFNWDEPQSQQDIYVAGNHFTTGKVFKNNTLLYSITDSIDIQLKGIQVAEDGTVYGAGYAYSDSELHGCVWMNDSCIFAADTNTLFDHIALSGNDWTVAGGNNVWQNGELLYSYNHGEDECHIHGLAIDTTTGNIYSGGAVVRSGEYHASVWQDDALLWMEDTISSVQSICFDGENLYSSGFLVENDSIFYGVIWQNDSIIYQMENANFVCIAAFNGSLYWTGISLTDTIVCIWQDGEELYSLPELSGASNLVINESGVYYTDAETVYKDGEVLYQPDEWCILTDLVVKPAPTPPEYTITVESDNPDWGTVSGGGTYYYGDTIQIEAFPNIGHEFLCWNDGSVNNPRDIVVTQDSTFVAHFGRLQYTITVESDHPEWGSVSGGGTYYYGDTIEIAATPNLGHIFMGWNDGNNDNPREIIVTEDHTYTGLFTVQQCVITTEVTPEGAGTVTGGGIYYYGDTITLTAQSNTGYDFVSWDDGVTDNPRTVIVEGDATFTAVFNLLQYEITTAANPEEGGTVTGGGIYEYGSTAILTATPNDGFLFLCWNDGGGSNPRHVTVTGDATYTALFMQNGTPTYIITVLSNNPLLGDVTGSGEYPEGSTIEISATPSPQAFFRGWDDGNTDNPRSIIVTEDMTFTAIFEVIPQTYYDITVVSNDPLMGRVTGSGTFPVNATTTIEAIPYSGFYFTGWQDGNTDNPREILVIGDAIYTAYFDLMPVQTFTIMVQYDENQGYVLGGGSYVAGSTATLAAIANDGYYFVKWGDGNTDNPREILVDHDIIIAAFFNGTGVDEYDGRNISLYPNPASDKIRIEGLEEGDEISIYNAFGTCVKKLTLVGDNEIAVDDCAAGLYLVRINGRQTVKFVKR